MQASLTTRDNHISAMLAERISAADYHKAMSQRFALGQHMRQFHAKYDLLLTPMMPVPALPVGQDLNDPVTEDMWIDWSPFSYPFNMTRSPAGSVCVGLSDAGGLPSQLHQGAWG